MTVLFSQFAEVVAESAFYAFVALYTLSMLRTAHVLPCKRASCIARAVMQRPSAR
jgi:hypothetical protein